MSPLSIILLSQLKKSSGLNQERNLHRSSHLQEKTVQNSSKQICGWILMWETTGDGPFHCRKHCYGFWPWSKNLVKTPKCFLQTHSFSLLKTLTDRLEWCGLLVDYCDVFISCLDSHSDGTHSLQSIHWWTSEWYISPNLMKKQTPLQLFL